MGLETYHVARDHFEPDENTHLAFPCCACRHRHGTDKEEPCIRCDWNLGAKPDDELPPNDAAHRGARQGASGGADCSAAT